MSEDPDWNYIFFVAGNNHDGNTDDENTVTREDSETENFVNTNAPGDASVIQPNFERHDENAQLFGMAHGVEGAEVQRPQLVSQMSLPANSKRCISESREQDFCSSSKKGRSSPRQDNTSPPRKHNTGRNVFEKFYDEYHQNRLRAFQHCFQDLRQLTEQMNRQVARMNEIFSEIQRFWERSPMSQRLSVEAPIVIPPPGAPSVANNPDRMHCSDIQRNEGMNPDTALPSVCFLPSFGMRGTAGASLEKSPETENYPPNMGNDNGQYPLSSSASSSSDSAGKKFMLMEMPAHMEDRPENSPEIISCPSSLGSDREQSSSSSFVCICPNRGMPNEEEAGLSPVDYESDISSYSSLSSLPSIEFSSEMRPESASDPNLMESDSDQDDTESSSISSNLETSVEAEISMESNPDMMIHPDLLRYYSGQHPSSSSASHSVNFGYFGNPSRHIKIPNSVINTAKSMCRPELSAKYLLQHLFTEDVLLKSCVYGSLEEDLCALDSNRINALREFLQENYPVSDLEENGCDWRLCVIAMDNHILSFRSDLKKTMMELQKQLSASNPSTKPAPEP